MFRAVQEPLPGRAGVRVTVNRDTGESLSCAEVFNAWRSDEAFRAFYTGVLARAPLEAYRWETPAIAGQTLARPFINTSPCRS